MEMLNNFSLILGFDLWHVIISWFGSWIVNYGWAIIVFTIALKLLMSPLDIYQKISTKKQQKFQTAMQPELQAVQAKYANDREKLNQETAKVYKKYNFNVGGMCFSMLITMGVSMIVLFTLFSSLRSYGTKKLYSSYQELDKVCIDVIDGKEIADLTLEEQTTLNIAIEQKYEELSKENSWLWVKNVWKKDTKESQFVKFDDYANYMGYADEDRTEAKARYDYIVNAVEDGKSQPNGYYILLILAVAITFLTQWISTKITMPKGQKLNKANIIMMCIIPLTMAILASTSNVVFTLYIIVNSVMSAIISSILALAMKPKSKDGNEDIVLPKKNVEVVEYSRNYKKES